MIDINIKKSGLKTNQYKRAVRNSKIYIENFQNITEKIVSKG